MGEKIRLVARGSTSRSRRVTVVLVVVVGMVMASAVPFVGFATAQSAQTTGSNDSASSDGIDLRTISYGETKSGEIDESDPQSDENRGFYEPVTFDGQAGDTVTIEMRGDRATYLILRGPDGEEIDRAGGGGPSGYTQLEEVRLPASGQYTIVATSYSRSATFPYELTLTRTGASSDGIDLRTISYEETKNGSIDTSDPHSDENRGFHEPVTFDGQAGENVSIEMRVSRGGSPRLILRAPDGEEITRSGYAGPTGYAIIRDVRLPATGQYTIVATTHDPMEVVELYELELHRLVTADDGPELPIAYGQTKSEELDASDPQSNEERGYYDRWVFTGQTGDTVTIEMRGDRATYLILRGPDGEEIDRAGGGGPSGYTQLEEVRLPASGQYTIVATSYSRSATFPYELTLTRTGTSSDGDVTGTATATEDPVGGDGDGDDGEDGVGDGETSANTPGFGAGIAVLAILGVVLLALRRR